MIIAKSAREMNYLENLRKVTGIRPAYCPNIPLLDYKLKTLYNYRTPFVGADQRADGDRSLCGPEVVGLTHENWGVIRKRYWDIRPNAPSIYPPPL